MGSIWREQKIYIKRSWELHEESIRLNIEVMRLREREHEMEEQRSKYLHDESIKSTLREHEI